MCRWIILAVGAAFATGLMLSLMPAYARTDASARLKKLEAKIETLEREQKQHAHESGVASTLEDAKWELFTVSRNQFLWLLGLLLGGGGVVFFAAHRGLRRMLLSSLSKRFSDDMKNKLDVQMAFSESIRLASHGYLLSDIAEVYSEGSHERSGYLKIAREQYESALKELEKLPQEHPAKHRRTCVVKNNLADCLALLGDLELKGEAVEYARHASENASEYPDAGFHWEDTYGWVLLKFAETENERKRAVDILNALYSRPQLPQGWVPERKRKLEEFLRH